MSVGLDAEGLLAIYADWIAFLREKQGQFEGQLARLQGKGHGKEQTPPVPVVTLPEAPGVVAPPVPPSAATPEEEAPAWLFEAASAPEAEKAPAVSAVAPDEEGDEWM